MQVDMSKKPIAFRINYLLGGEESQVRLDFPIDYKESGSFKLFENYIDAKTLRTLVIMRSSVFKDYEKYSKKKYKDLGNYCGVDIKSVSYLKQHNIPIDKIFKELNIVDYVNTLTYMIDIITFKVLVDLEIPYSDEMIVYFKYPKFTKETLKEYVELCEDILVPRGIYFYDMGKIKATLKYSMNNDMNCVFSAFSLLGKPFDGVLDVSNFEYRSSVGEDLDKNAVIDSEKIVSQIKEENRVELERIKAIENETEEKRKAEVERIAFERAKKIELESTIESEKLEKVEDEPKVTNKKGNKKSNSLYLPNVVKRNLNRVSNDMVVSVKPTTMKSVDPVKPIINNEVVNSATKSVVNILDKNIVHPSVISDKPIMIVDCHNINFYNFMCYLNKYGEKYIEKVVLVCDFKSNILWNFVDELYDKVKVDKIDCVNIENVKGNTDVVLTHEVSKYAYACGAKNISIVSNATSFYNLFDIVKGAKLQICTEIPNKLPMDYLKSYDVSVFTITTTVEKCGIDFMSNDLVECLAMYSLLFKPLISYTKEDIISFVKENIGTIIDDFTVEKVVTDILTDISIKISGGKILINSAKKSVIIKS